jgi:3-amino-5-hydroxybenzoate synthase
METNMKTTLETNIKTSMETKTFPKWPMFDNRELELIEQVVKSQNWWRMTGDKVSSFEKLFADFNNAKYCLGVTNGTTAIELILAAMDIKKGDEVIVPGFTFISTATAVIYAGATPVIVDVNLDTYCMDVNAFEKAITEKTKAVIPVHLAGNMCNMEEIYQIAKKHNLKIIEDAAHAHGGEYKGYKAGKYSDAAIFSFQNGKLMTCGEGGAIITNNKEIYDKAFLIHGVGRPLNDTDYQHLELGSNYRMTEFQAAILIAQLERLNKLNAVREKNSQLLDNLLREVKGITPQKKDENTNLHPHYMYMFHYDPKFFNGLPRKEFVIKLNQAKIPAYRAYPVVSETSFFKSNNFRNHINDIPKNDNLVNCKEIADYVVWLPHFTLLGDEGLIHHIKNTIDGIQSGKI